MSALPREADMERKKGASDARIAAILHYVETTSPDIDPEAMEVMRIAEAAKATNRGQ
jgi:septin family protein